MKRGLRHLHRRWLSTILALSVLGTQCLFGYQVENNFWSERRKSTRRTSSTLLASLPLDAGSVGANSLTAQFPAPQRVGSTLSASIARSVPQRFSKEHAKILSTLSPAHGTIRKVSFPKDPSAHGPVVIHIQDVHMNQEAQWNIRETVISLIGSGQVNLIALEGATEPIDLQAFADYPHAKAVEMAADYLLKENKISGPIHAALTARGKLPKILGIDDPAHYEANVQAYRDSAPKLEKTRQDVRTIQRELEAQKRIVYSPALQSFDRQVHQYREGKSSLGDFVHLLTNQVDPDRKGNEVGHFLEALHTERTLDFKQVESERARLIERLTQTLTAEETNNLVAQSLDYRAGRLRYGDFYTALSILCKKKGVHLKSYPALDSYVKYVLLADGIDAEQLMTEVAALEKTAYARQIKTPEEKSLAARSRQAWLTGKLVDFALTPTEWEEYNGGPRPLAPKDLESFESFYKEAHTRDMAMAQNLLQAMKDAPSPSRKEEKSVTLLVTGGFHAEGMAQQLTRQGATVLSYIPKIEKVDTAQGSTYLSVFTQEKSPLEKLFVGEKLFLATNPIERTDLRIRAPLLVASVTLFLGLLTASFDFSSAYQLAGGIGNLSSLELSKTAVAGVISISVAKLAFEVAGPLPGDMSIGIEPMKEKRNHFWRVLRDAGTEELFGNYKNISLSGLLKGRLPAIILGAGMGVPGPFSMLFGGVLLLWVIKGVPQQYQFVLDHVNQTSQQIKVRFVGTILLNVIAFSLPFFGDFVFMSSALLAGTTGAIGAHTLWNILAEAGQKLGLWQQDYRLHIFNSATFSHKGVDFFLPQEIIEEAQKKILKNYSDRIKKIAPNVWFTNTGGDGAELSRDRQQLIFHTPSNFKTDAEMGSFIEKALSELERYLARPDAGVVNLIPFSLETGEFEYIQKRLKRIHEEAKSYGQELLVLVERPSFLKKERALSAFFNDPNYFQQILFENITSWANTFRNIQSSMELMTRKVELAISAGELLGKDPGGNTLLGWLSEHQLAVDFEDVASDSQRLFLQSLWLASGSGFWAPWPVKHLNGHLDLQDIESLEKKQLGWALALAKNQYLRAIRLGEKLSTLPISPRRAYVVIYGPEHLPYLLSVPDLAVVPAHAGESYDDLEIRRANSPTLSEQLVQEIRLELAKIYGANGAGDNRGSQTQNQRILSEDILEAESEKWTPLIQKAFLFSLFVRGGERTLHQDDELRLSRLVEKITDSMSTQAIRRLTMGLLNQDPSQWELLLTAAERISSQDRNFLITVLQGNRGNAASLWGAGAWEKLFGESRTKYYRLAAPFVATGAAMLLVWGVWFLGGPAVAGNFAFLIGSVFSLVFIASHVKALTPKSWRPKTNIPVSWVRVLMMAFLYGFSITLALSGLGGVDRFGVDAAAMIILAPIITVFSFLTHGFFDGWGRIFWPKMIAPFFLAAVILTPSWASSQDENASAEPPSISIVDMFNGSEYLITAFMMGISPENKNEFELIRLPEAQEFMKINISRENLPIPVAIIDLSNGEVMPTVLTKNMALDNHGSSMADIVHQVAGDQAEVWTLSGGFKSEAGDYNMSGIGKAVQYAVREGARVIMISLSGDGSNEAREAIKEALDKGVLVVMAVGNDGLEDTAILPSYDERILMVGSVLGNGERAPESNFGKTIEGVKVVDIFAPGRLIVTLPDGKKDLAIGTSFTPSVVGGLAVLLLSINNNLNGAEVTDVIEGTASNKRQGLPVVDFLQAVRKIIPVRRNSPGKFSPSTLEWFWRWMPDRGALHDVLQRGPRESVPPVIGMGFAMLAYVTMGASFGWVVAVALVTGVFGYSHRWGTYGFRNGQLVPRTGMVADSLAKAASWFFWITVFGGLLWGLGQVVPSDLVPSVLALGTWVGAYIGFDRHRRSNREYIVNNIPDLTDAQRTMARQILKNLKGRPVTLDMNQMRELVVRTAENVGRGKDIGAIDLLATSAQSSPGIKFMFVSRASLTAKGLENLRAILAGDENVFVLSDAPVPEIPEGRTLVIPFRPLPQGSRGNLPFREVLLTEVRGRIDALDPNHPLRRRSSEAVTLFHTPDLQLKGEGLESNDPLAQAAKNPTVLLLESLRAFPVFNRVWQDSLKALLALAEFA